MLPAARALPNATCGERRLREQRLPNAEAPNKTMIRRFLEYLTSPATAEALDAASDAAASTPRREETGIPSSCGPHRSSCERSKSRITAPSDDGVQSQAHVGARENTRDVSKPEEKAVKTAMLNVGIQCGSAGSILEPKNFEKVRRL